MEIKFYSYAKSGDKIYYKSDLVIEDNSYFFVDNMNSDCKLTLNKESIYLVRSGEVKQDLNFVKGKKTKSLYKTKDLSMELLIYTKEIIVNPSSIQIEYDAYYDDFLTDSFKIVFLIKK